MKTKNILGKLLIVSSLLTFASFVIAGWSLSKLYQEDPQILSRLHYKDLGDEDWFRFDRNTSLSINTADRSQDEWIIGSKIKRITIKTYNGNFEIKKSKTTEIRISATGALDKSISPRLLEIDDTADELMIQQPKDDAVTDLDFIVEIPETTVETLDVFAAGSDFLVADIQIKTLNLKSVSGDVVIRNSRADDVDVKSVQGSVRFEDMISKNLNVKSVSGEVDYRSQSGSNLDITSVSGEVRLQLAKEVNYLISVKSVAGQVENSYKSADGEEFKVQVSTTSGDVRIE